MEDRTITIDQSDYDILVRAEQERDILLRGLINTAELSYDLKRLTFSDAPINTILTVLRPKDVADKLKELRTARELFSKEAAAQEVE